MIQNTQICTANDMTFVVGAACLVPVLSTR
jgi:hypothetical protein